MIQIFNLILQILTILCNYNKENGPANSICKQRKMQNNWISFFPVELKSDDDVLDGRLPNQILNAILTFGRAILVLDKKHSERAQLRGTLNLIPASIMGYTGREDYFEVLSVFRRFIRYDWAQQEKACQAFRSKPNR
jgi:hypothetical protein